MTRPDPHGAADDGYAEPVDPWGGHDVWGGAPASAVPGTAGFDATAEPPPVKAAEPPPAAPPRNGPIITLVVVLALLVVGGLIGAGWLVQSRDRGQAQPPATTPATPSPPVSPRSGDDARFAQAGQCVRNEGTAGNPQMRIAPCRSGTFEVLRRIDGRTTGEQDAQRKCSGRAPRYTTWFFFNSDLDSLDYVLCLRRR